MPKQSPKQSVTGKRTVTTQTKELEPDYKRQVTELTQQLEKMKKSLDANRDRVQQLKENRPKVRFIGPWTKQSWEVLSLRGRLRAVE